MSELEPKPSVLRDLNGIIRISKIRSDTDPATTLNLIDDGQGNVGISITDPERGTVGVDLYPYQGGGSSPEITKKFRDLIKELADQIESGK